MDLSLDAAAAIDAEVTATCARERLPSVIAAVVDHGRICHAASAGEAAALDDVYRIASMTKSFTAATVLALRDDGLLLLDDPVATYVPELIGLRPPTADSPEITVRHLLTMSAGMATDDAWGDRHLDVSNETLSDWFRLGATFAHPPGITMDYSNYGYAMLGRVIENVAGAPYDQVVTDRLLRPLGMHHTAFRLADLPADAVIAMPHHPVDDERVRDDANLLDHGGFGAMGGLWSTLADLAIWVDFLQDGFPPRDESDEGPLCRASRRLMQQVHRAYEPPTIFHDEDRAVRMIGLGYGMGLEVLSHGKLGKILAHSGGLPGYGSNMRWSIECGVGIVALSNLTYAPMRGLADRLLDLLVTHDVVPSAKPVVAPFVNQAATNLAALLNAWTHERADELFADNVALDEGFDRRAASAAQLIATHGMLRLASVDASSASEGDAVLTSDNDGSRFTLELQLSPTVPPLIQWYELTAEPAQVEAATAESLASLSLETAATNSVDSSADSTW
jgi:CubicO group peptidase (beta-lactamase class C family)